MEVRTLSDYSLLVEASRAFLSSFAALYFYQALQNFKIMRSFLTEEHEMAKNRTLLSLFCSLFCLSELWISYCGGSDAAKYALFFIYFNIITVTYYYLQSMKHYYVGGEKFRKFFSRTLILTLFIHVTFSLYQFFIDTSFPYLYWSDAYLKNPIMIAAYGGKFFYHGALFSLMVILFGYSMFSILISMLIGRHKEKYNDPIILLGVILSMTFTSWEVFTSTFYPELFIFVAFVGNYPEVSRITNLAQNKLIQSLHEERKKVNTLAQIKQQAIEEARFKSITSLSNGVAHEINNPLTIILANVKRGQRALEKPESEKESIEKAFETIGRTTERIATIITQLRFSSAHEKDFNSEYTPIKDLVFDLNNSRHSTTSAQEIDFSIQLSNDLEDQLIFCDRPQIAMALRNLIENAFEAVHKSSSPHPFVKAQISRSENFLNIVIKDSGDGINDDIRDKIFDPFFTTKEVGAGMGLGLSTAKWIIERHQGTIEHSRRDKMTTFKVSIPIT